MELALTFAFYGFQKEKENQSTTEYKYMRKFWSKFGKKKFGVIMNHFNSENSCIGIKDEEGKYRIAYFSK